MRVITDQLRLFHGNLRAYNIDAWWWFPVGIIGGLVLTALTR